MRAARSPHAATIALGLLAAMSAFASCRCQQEAPAALPISDGQRFRIEWPAVLPCGDFAEGLFALEGEQGNLGAGAESSIEWTTRGTMAARWRSERVPLESTFPVARADGIVVHMAAGASARAMRVALACRGDETQKSDVHWTCAAGACAPGATYAREAPVAVAAAATRHCDFAAFARRSAHDLESNSAALVQCGVELVREIDAALAAACAVPARCAPEVREAAGHLRRFAAATDWIVKDADGKGAFTVATTGAQARLTCERLAPSDAACAWRLLLRRGRRVMLRYLVDAERIDFGTAADGSGEGQGAILASLPGDGRHMRVEGSALGRP